MPVLHHNGCGGSVDRRQPHGIWSRTLRDGCCKDNREYNYRPAGPTACWLHYSSIGRFTSLWNFWFWFGRRSRRLLKDSKLIAKIISLSRLQAMLQWSWAIAVANGNWFIGFKINCFCARTTELEQRIYIWKIIGFVHLQFKCHWSVLTPKRLNCLLTSKLTGARIMQIINFYYCSNFTLRFWVIYKHLLSSKIVPKVVFR